jgi:hypothetical protein
MYAYNFQTNQISGEPKTAYWRDVGTIDAYYEANVGSAPGGARTRGSTVLSPMNIAVSGTDRLDSLLYQPAVPPW